MNSINLYHKNKLKTFNIQQFASSSEPSEQSEVPSHNHDAGKHSYVSNLVLQ